MIEIKWSQTFGAYEIKTGPMSRGDFNTTIACIKTIPAINRSYDESAKSWYVTETFLSILETLLKAQNLPYHVTPKPVAPPPFMQGSSLSEEDKYILTFMKLLPYEVTAKAFKLGMVSLHPDKNPNDSSATDKSATLSEAWAFIEKNFYKR